MIGAVSGVRSFREPVCSKTVVFDATRGEPVLGDRRQHAAGRVRVGVPAGAESLDRDA